MSVASSFYEESSLKEIDQSLDKLSGQAHKLLALLAYFHPDGVPKMLVRPAVGVESSILPRFITDAVAWTHATSALRKSHMMTFDDGEAKLLHINPRYRDAMLERLSDEEDAETLRTAIRLLHRVFPSPGKPFVLMPTATLDHALSHRDDGDDDDFGKIKELGDSLYRHGIALIEKESSFDRGTVSSEMAGLVKNVYWFLHQRGLFAEALAHVDAAKAVLQRDHDGQPLNLAFLAAVAGSINDQSGHHGTAVEYFITQLKAAEESIATKSCPCSSSSLSLSNVSESYQLIAVAIQQQGRYQESLPLHEKAVELARSQLAAEKRRSDKWYDATTALTTARMNRSWALWRTGDAEGAVKDLAHVLKKTEEMLEGSPASYWTQQIALRIAGSMSLSPDKDIEGIVKFQEAARQRLETWDKQAFEPATVSYCCAAALEEGGDIEASIEQYTQSLECAEKATIRMDAHIARTRYMLGNLLVSQNKDVERGRQLVQEAETARKEIETALGASALMREGMEFVDKAMVNSGYKMSAAEKAYNALQLYDDELPYWAIT